MNVKTLPFDSISFNINRKYGGEGDIKILAEDIKHSGLINPVTVKEFSEGSYEIVTGRRRMAAMKLLGWGQVPAYILPNDKIEHAEEIALSENVNRLPMHPLDEAVYFKRLLENGEPIQQIAERCDLKVAEIHQRIRLLSLEPVVRELFRDGKLSLAAAAMLADLDAYHQALFVEKEGDCHYYNNKIPDYAIRNFISGLYHDKLFGFIADKECAGCKKRTCYTDKTLFPDFDGEQDCCLDHACYLSKWEKTLEKAIQAAVIENPEFAGARILVTNDDNIKQIFGNTVTLGQDEYQVKRWSWDTDAEKPGKDTRAALRVFTTARSLEFRLTYWRPKPQKTESESEFKPVLKLLDLPKEEQKAVIGALKDKKISPYEFNRKIRERVFGRLLEIKSTIPGEDKDIKFFIRNFVFKDRFDRELDKEKKGIFKLFAGYEYDGDVGRLILHTPWEKLFVLMTALTMDDYSYIPNAEDFDLGKKKKYLDWFSLSGEEARNIYREEIRKLLPKPKAEKTPAKTAKGKKK